MAAGLHNGRKLLRSACVQAVGRRSSKMYRSLLVAFKRTICMVKSKIGWGGGGTDCISANLIATASRKQYYQKPSEMQ